MKALLGVLLCVPIVFWGGCRIVKTIQFDQACGGYLKRAADANTVELGMRELKVALDYAEANRLTSGYTSILWNTPDEDVGFWYRNLKASAEELAVVSPETSQLERTNVLMKLRETLLDNGEKGTRITVPDGISVYPHNATFALFGSLSLLCLIVGIVLIVTWLDEY